MASAFVLPTSRSSIKLMNPVKRADKLYMADENEKSLIETTEKGVASFFAPALPFALSALYRKNLAEREEKLIEEELAVLKAKQKLKEEQFKEDILVSLPLLDVSAPETSSHVTHNHRKVSEQEHLVSWCSFT